MIETIKIQGNGYLVNGTLVVPKADGNRDYEEVKLAIAGNNENYPTAILVEDEFTKTELDQQAQDIINQDALTYLANTDWMLLRELDGGVAMTANVKTLRVEARLRVV